jgi:hypothetical protein
MEAVEGGQYRERITGRRGGSQVAANGTAVSDLWRANGSGRLDQWFDVGHRADDLGVGFAGAEEPVTVLAPRAFQFLEV